MNFKKQNAPLFRVVLADDQAEIRNVIRRFLERDGRFEIVAEVGTGEDAVRAARAELPDGMILDLAMPDMDGLSALPEILRESPGTQIVILSSMVPFMDMKAKAASLGAAAVFDKHFSPKKLAKELVTILTVAAQVPA